MSSTIAWVANTSPFSLYIGFKKLPWSRADWPRLRNVQRFAIAGFPRSTFVTGKGQVSDITLIEYGGNVYGLFAAVNGARTTLSVVAKAAAGVTRRNSRG